MEPRQRFHHYLGPLAAGSTLAAGLLCQKLHRPVDNIDYIPAPVKDNDGAGAEDGFKGKGSVYLLAGDNSPGSAAYLYHFGVFSQGQSFH